MRQRSKALPARGHSCPQHRPDALAQASSPVSSGSVSLPNGPNVAIRPAHASALCCGQECPRAGWVLILLLWAFFPNPAISATNAAVPQTLPKVRIAKDGRTFEAEHKPFVPFGVTYYRPGTGWAPQVWKKFDAAATEKDFVRMKELGVNCARVFLSHGSFYKSPGKLEAEGLEKFDQFLRLAERAGIYVHPTGPDHWEGPPEWSPVAVEDGPTLAALEAFWKLFAARYRGLNVIFAYDLRNEPEVGWNDGMQSAWNQWLQERYVSSEKLKSAWGSTNEVQPGNVPVPPPKDEPGSRRLLDFQHFREHLASEWTRRQAAAIKSVDPEALVTVGMIQWAVPVLLPAGARHYAGFRPELQARYLDFLEIHFYPLARGAFDYRSPDDEEANLAYLESVVREVARPGKPVLVAEFGWYGGGKPRFDQGAHPFATEEQQAGYCRRVVETSAGLACGWLNWGFYDQPEATDCSEFTGLMTADGKLKAWGKTFAGLAKDFASIKPTAPPPLAPRPVLDWEACITSAKAGYDFSGLYLRDFLRDSRPHGAISR